MAEMEEGKKRARKQSSWIIFTVKWAHFARFWIVLLKNQRNENSNSSSRLPSPYVEWSTRCNLIWSLIKSEIPTFLELPIKKVSIFILINDFTLKSNSKDVSQWLAECSKADKSESLLLFFNFILDFHPCYNRQVELNQKHAPFMNWANKKKRYTHEQGDWH
jgi:hypothetical protein